MAFTTSLFRGPRVLTRPSLQALSSQQSASPARASPLTAALLHTRPSTPKPCSLALGYYTLRVPSRGHLFQKRAYARDLPEPKASPEEEETMVRTYRKKVQSSKTAQEMGLDLFNAGDIDGAIKCFRHAIDFESSNKATSQHMLGVCYMKKENYVQAIASFDSALRTIPDSSTLLNKGQALQALGEYMDALDCYNDVLEIELEDKQDEADMARARSQINPKYKTTENVAEIAWLSKGSVFMELQEIEEAIDSFTKTIELNHQNAHALASRAQAYNYIGQNDKALEDIQKAASLSSDFDYVLAKATILSQLQQLDAAIIDFKAALSSKPFHVTAVNGLACCYIQQNRNEEAVEVLTKTIKEYDLFLNTTDPRYSKEEFDQFDDVQTIQMLFHNRGHGLTSLGRYDEAMQDFAKAIELEPNEPQHFIERARAHEGKGDLEAAKKDKEHAKRLQAASTSKQE